MKPLIFPLGTCSRCQDSCDNPSCDLLFLKERRSICADVFPWGFLQESLDTRSPDCPSKPRACICWPCQQACLRLQQLKLVRLWMTLKIAWFLLSQARIAHVFQRIERKTQHISSPVSCSCFSYRSHYCLVSLLILGAFGICRGWLVRVLLTPCFKSKKYTF